MKTAKKKIGKKTKNKTTGLKAAVITLSVVTALLIAAVGTFAGLRPAELKEIILDKPLFTQQDKDAAVTDALNGGFSGGYDKGKDEGYNAGLTDGYASGLEDGQNARRYVKAGDVINGFYYNTLTNPNFDLLDWDKSDIDITPDTNPDLFETNDIGAVELNVKFLACSYSDIPTVFDATYEATTQEALSLQVWRYVFASGEPAYMVLMNVGNGIYITPDSPISKEGSGWKTDSPGDKDSVVYDGSDVIVRYTAEAEIWSEWISPWIKSEGQSTALNEGDVFEHLYVNVFATSSDAWEKVIKSMPEEGNRVFKYNSAGGETLTVLITSLNLPHTDYPAGSYAFMIQKDAQTFVPIYASTEFNIEGITAVKGWQNVTADGEIVIDGKPISGEVVFDETDYTFDSVYGSKAGFDTMFSATPFPSYSFE